MKLRFVDLLHPIDFLTEELVSRRDAKEWINGLSKTVMYHAFKCMVATDERLLQHWIKELCGYYNDLDDIELKPTCRKPPFKMFYELLYNARFCNPKNVLGENAYFKLVRQAQKDYKTGLDLSISREELIAPMYQFYVRFCESLARGNVSDDFIAPTLLTLRVR